jgi:predicted ester cyclase
VAGLSALTLLIVSRRVVQALAVPGRRRRRRIVLTRVLAGTRAKERSMGTEENKAVMRRIFVDVINGKDLDVADELFADEHELHPEAPGVGRGADGMKGAFAGLHEEFPDVRVEIESMVAEGDLVAVRLTFSGTHAVSGERATWPETVFTRFSGGKAVESWELTDTGRSPGSPPW